MNPGLLPRLRLAPRAFAILLMLLFLAAPAYPGKAGKPNILLILADDLGWKDLSFNGSRFYETPNIDRLASEGTFFSNAYSNAPICAPSRAALLSGQYAPRTGFYTNHQPERGKPSWRAVVPTPNHHGLKLEKITLAETLKAQGYKTMHAGKWHLGDTPDLYPEHQGFTINIAGNKAGKPNTYFSPYDLPNLENGPPGEYLTDRLTSEGIHFMEENRDGPFFLYMSYHSPHTPLQAMDSLVWKYLPKPHDNGQFDPVYAAMIEALDQNVGRLMDCLEQLDLSGETIIVFFSDNGTAPFVAPEEPFRGFKGTLYEGGIRVPLIIRWPGSRGGQTNATPVAGIDLYPTLIDLAGLDPLRRYPLDGLSLRPLLEGEPGFKREALFWHFPAYLQAEYGMEEVWRTTPVSAVRNGKYKLLEFLEDGHRELYDLENDPGEKENLAGKQAGLADELFDLLQGWRSAMDVPYPLEKNSEYDPSSLPTSFKSGERSDIYKPRFMKKNKQP